MKRVVSLLSFVTLIALLVACLEPAKAGRGDEKFYKQVEQETDDYVVEIVDAVAEEDFSKLKVKITNKTNDYLFFDGSKCVFKFEFGDFKPDERVVMIEPYGSDSKVLNVDGGNNFSVDNYTFVLGGLSKVPSQGTAIEAPDFQLPPVVNDFRAGPFQVGLKKLKQETDETAAKFEVTYNGSNVGLIDPGRLGVKLEDGQEFANAKRDYTVQLLERGDDDKFTAYFNIPAKITDMQFATMWIVWRNTFQEAKRKAVNGMEISMVAQGE